MNKAHFPLQNYAGQLLESVQQALKQTNPGLYLYENKVRTPLFMEESLLRLLNKLMQDPELKEELKLVKKLEDGLGRIDDYDHFFQLFSSNKKVEKRQIHYFLKEKEKEIEKLNKKASRKKFYLATFNKLIGKKNYNFNSKTFIKKLQDQLEKEIAICFRFYLRFPETFTDLDSQLHEIRRKLRWINIYAQSLGGVIILEPVKEHYAWQKKFITPAELKSPYTKLPVKKHLEAYIRFNKKVFFAWSYVVARLGEIKDEILEMEMLEKSIRKTKGVSRQEASDSVRKQLNLKRSRKKLFKEAHNLLEEFFIQHKMHELLIIKEKI